MQLRGNDALVRTTSLVSATPAAWPPTTMDEASWNGTIDLVLAVNNCEGSVAFLLTLLQGMREEHANQTGEMEKFHAAGDIAGLK